MCRLDLQARMGSCTAPSTLASSRSAPSMERQSRRWKDWPLKMANSIPSRYHFWLNKLECLIMINTFIQHNPNWLCQCLNMPLNWGTLSHPGIIIWHNKLKCLIAIIFLQGTTLIGYSYGQCHTLIGYAHGLCPQNGELYSIQVSLFGLIS